MDPGFQMNGSQPTQHLNFFDNDDYNSMGDAGFMSNSEVPPPPDDLPAPPVADLSFLDGSSSSTHRLDFSQPDNESNILRDGNTLKAATFSKLIEHLTQPHAGMLYYSECFISLNKVLFLQTPQISFTILS